jgi:hypothetical protein
MGKLSQWTTDLRRQRVAGTQPEAMVSQISSHLYVRICILRVSYQDKLLDAIKPPGEECNKQR